MSGGRPDDDPVVAREFALDEPCRAAARQMRLLSRRAGELVPRCRQARLDREGGGLEIIAAGPLRATERIPRLVDVGGRATERRDDERERPLLEWQRCDVFADARDASAATPHTERHVGTQP